MKTIDLRYNGRWRMDVVPKLSGLTGPGGLAGSAVWLKASMGITLVDAKVSLWEDQSGNNRDVSQASATWRPTLGTTPNGKPVMVFTPTAWMSNVAITGMNSLAGCTYFCVGYTSAQADNRFWWSMKGTSTVIGHYVNGNSLYTYASSETDYAYGAKAITATNDVYKIYSTIYDGSLTGDTNRLKLYTNGTQLTSLTIPQPVPAALDNAATTLAVGYYPTTSLFHKGGIAELIIFPSALSTANHSLVLAYLGTEYGITVA